MDPNFKYKSTTNDEEIDNLERYMNVRFEDEEVDDFSSAMDYSQEKQGVNQARTNHDS